MICYHHNDADGRCAAAIVDAAYPADKRFVEVDYKDDISFEQVKPNEQIVIVDFSFEPEKMTELLAITQDVIWIDHHKTAIAKYEDFPQELKGLRDISKSGCELTWDYFFPSVIMPEAVALIGDRDTWQWKYGDRTKHLYYALRAEDTRPQSLLWQQLLDGGWDLDAILERGKGYVAYQESCNRSLMGAAFPVTFEGHNCIALNSPRISSETFGEHDYDIMLGFYSSGGKWTVSLYSTKVDVAKIAVKHGGGGHTGAAGFVCDEVPFL